MTNLGEKVARVRIKMDQDFSAFSQAKRQEFLHELASLAGLPVEDIRQVEFCPGCVVFSGEFSDEAARRILELFEAAEQGGVEDPEVKRFAKFAKKFLLKGVSGPWKLQVVVPRYEDKESIVFIHGWRGDKDSFGKLPEYLSDALGVETLPPYEYPTGIWEDSPALTFIASNLENWIRKNTNAGRLGFVAHSMGGLLLRKVIVSQAWRKEGRSLLPRIRQMTFVASPHSGAVLAGLAKKIPTLRKAQLDDLNPNSPFLYDLNKAWSGWVLSGVSKSCQIRCVVGEKDEIVSKTNASGLDSEAVAVLGVGHREIVKPQSSDSEIVTTISMFMRDAGIGALPEGLKQSWWR